MSQPVEMVRAELGPVLLALELTQLQSVLTAEEARGLELLDVRDWLGARARPLEHVGLVTPPSQPPLGIGLGRVIGVERWGPQRLYPLPGWLQALAPPILLPACGWDPERLRAIWLLDVEALIHTHRARR